jgi:hypothetical protein
MIRSLVFLVFLVFMLGAPAQAAVVAVDGGGFITAHEVRTPLAPREALSAFVKIGAWWSDSHTYSGAARNLKIDLRPGGCWCESFKNGGFVRHMTLEYYAPEKTLRFAGGLGPLQEMGVSGAMTVQFAPAPTGGSIVSLRYVVNGRDAGAWRETAGAVDRVLAEQIARYSAYRP